MNQKDKFKIRWITAVLVMSLFGEINAVIQNLFPFDFEDGDEVFTSFGVTSTIVANPDVSDINQVIKY